MGFIKRGMVFVKRMRGRAFTLFLLVFTLGTLMSGAISIQRAIGNTESNLRRRLPSYVTVILDTEEIWERTVEIGRNILPEPLMPERIKEIGNLSYVERFDFSFAHEIYSRDILSTRNIVYDESFPSSFFLEGMNHPENFQMQEGFIELVMGRLFSESEIDIADSSTTVALISRELANKNHLTIGSTIPLESIVFLDPIIFSLNPLETPPSFPDNIAMTESLKIEVVGIFDINIPDDIFNSNLRGGDSNNVMNPNTLAREQLENTIYVPMSVVNHHQQMNRESNMELWEKHGVNDLEDSFNIESRQHLKETGFFTYDNLVFKLTDSQAIGDFTEAVQPLLPEFWKVLDLSSTHSQISVAMEGIQWLAQQILVGTALATIVTLNLLITFFLRDRKHEIGIYLTLGERKIKILTQIVMEILTIALLAIMLSLFVGSSLAASLSETMLRNDMKNYVPAPPQTEDLVVNWSSTHENSLAWFSNGNMSVEEMLSYYDVTLDNHVILLFFAVGIGVILTSTVIPILYITNLNPKKVLI